MSTLETLQNMASEMDCQVEILREIQLDSADDVHLVARRTTQEDGSPAPSRTLSTSLVINSGIQDEYNQVGGQDHSGTELVADSSLRSCNKTNTAPIDIAPVKKAVDQIARSKKKDSSNDMDDAPLSSSFSLNNLLGRDSLNGSGESSRASTPLRVLPAGRRYCLGQLQFPKIDPNKAQSGLFRGAHYEGEGGR